MPGPDEPPPSQPPPTPPVPLHPLAEPAVSTSDKAMMDRVRGEWMKIALESCDGCDERWFDLDVKDGKCQKCRHQKKSQKFQDVNRMDPDPCPDLPALTQIEEMIISPVHALVSLYQVRG
ncbi:hypothetical protein DFH09DRAFT_947192, partial [Mycena vulgaris]